MEKSYLMSSLKRKLAVPVLFCPCLTISLPVDSAVKAGTQIFCSATLAYADRSELETEMLLMCSAVIWTLPLQQAHTLTFGPN
jgi:hypothetical protein